MKEKVLRRGSPKIYSDAALLGLYAVMLLKQINALRLQRRGLYTHPVMLFDAETALLSPADDARTQRQSLDTAAWRVLRIQRRLGRFKCLWLFAHARL